MEKTTGALNRIAHRIIIRLALLSVVVPLLSTIMILDPRPSMQPVGMLLLGVMSVGLGTHGLAALMAQTHQAMPRSNRLIIGFWALGLALVNLSSLMWLLTH